MSASAHRGLARLQFTRRGRADPDVAQYRYGVVLLLIVCVVLFVIVAPDSNASRAIAFAIVGAALVVAIGTSREHSVVRRRRVVVTGTTIFVVTVLTAAGAIPVSITFAIAAVMTLAVPATLTGGLLRLVRERGATVQAVAGGLAIYLLLGLAFASAVGFTSNVESGEFFAQVAHPTTSDRVYYSFTVLTTTGFGDFTAAHSSGRALAVLEMLVGQIYLVTVISVLIGRRLEQSRS
jgi:fucose 4-O-acetylase-like acetyltransferase